MTTISTVIKRDNSTQIFDNTKIRAYLNKLSSDLSYINIDKLYELSQLSFSDRIHTTEILNILIRNAVDLIDEFNTDFQYLAARLFVNVIRREVWHSFTPTNSLYERIYSRSNIYDMSIFDFYTRSEIDFADKFIIDYNRDLILTYSALRQFRDKYLLQSRLTHEIYELPQEVNLLISLYTFHNYSLTCELRKFIKTNHQISILSLTLPEKIVSELGVKTLPSNTIFSNRINEQQLYEFLNIYTHGLTLDELLTYESLDIFRMYHVARAYYYISNLLISLPTPIYCGVRTKLKSFSSCCVIDCDDTTDSILSSQYALSKCVSNRYGIGLHIGRIRGIGASVRDDSVVSSGVVPFLKTFEAATKQFSQNSVRSGSCTASFQWWNYEVLTLLELKNNKGVVENRVRSIDYSIGLNKYFVVAAIKNKPVWLFSSEDVPELTNDYRYSFEEFTMIYEQYSHMDIRKKQINAQELLLKICKERFETGRIYIYFIDNINQHGAFNESIFASNLCQEIAIPTKPLDINTKDGLIAICILSCVNVGRLGCDTDKIVKMINKLNTSPKKSGSVDDCLKSRFDENCMTTSFDELNNIDDQNVLYKPDSKILSQCECIQLRSVCDTIVRLLNELIDYQEYPFIQLQRSAVEYRPLGIGISDLFHKLAQQHLKYDSIEGRNYVHSLVEHFQYYLIESSCNLARERKRTCIAFDKSKYSKNIFPIDTYKNTIDNCISISYECNWNMLKNKVRKYGLYNCCLSAIPPTASSCAISNSTPGIDPPRSAITSKLSKHGTFKQVIPEYIELKDYYDFAHTITNKEYFKLIGVIQKFIDQGISTNSYYMNDKYANNTAIGDIVNEIVDAYKYGLKSLYYLNSNKGVDKDLQRAFSRDGIVSDVSNENIKNNTIEEEEEDGCSGGACKL